ncbi:MAG: NUDIX hydrolase [Acutalibacter sp.]|nr:NUDIX hydrolase [Acutalibacter sp.]
MNRDWLFTGDGYLCDLRAVGVLVKDGMLLVQRDRGGNEYALPGGHVKIGETTADALVREFREETGAEIKSTRLLWTEECFWNWNGKAAHNISFYYLVELCKTETVPVIGEFVPHKDNDDVLIGWMSVENLKDITIYPAFLKEEISSLDSPPKHFVTRG